MTRRSAALLLGWLLSSSLLPLNTSAAATNEFAIGQVSPSYLTANSDVQLPIQVANAGECSVALSNQPLAGRSDVTAALNDSLDLPSSKVLAADVASGTAILTIPGAAFQGKSSGVYLVDVTCGGTSHQVLLPIQRGALDHRLQVVTLLPLTITPMKVGGDRYTNDGPLKQWLPNGNLAALLAAGSTTDHVSWLLDPDVVDTATSLADGGSVLTPDSHDVSGEVAQGAADFLAQLPAATTGHDVYLLPFAGADLNGLIARGQKSIARAALRQTAEVRALLGRADLASAAIAPRGDFSTDTWDWLAERSVYLSILSSSRWPANSTTATPSGVVKDPNGSDALVVDKQASRELTLSMVGNQAAAVHFQALLADLLLTAREVPEDRVLVLQPRTATSGFTVDNVTRALTSLSTPWVEAIGSSEGLATVATDGRTRVDSAVKPVFSASFSADIKALDRSRRSLRAVIGDTVHDYRLIRGELRIASSLFTANQQRAQLSRLTLSSANGVRNAVRIVSSGSVVFSSEKGVVPITILNDLEVEATVKVVATGLPAIRVQSDQMEPITIAPGKRKSIEIPTRLIGSDTAYLELQLLTLDDREIGQPVSITLSSSAYSKAAAWVVGGAFVLLVALIVVNTVRRVRVRRRDAKLAAQQ